MHSFMPVRLSAKETQYAEVMPLPYPTIIFHRYSLTHSHPQHLGTQLSKIMGNMKLFLNDKIFEK